MKNCFTYALMVALILTATNSAYSVDLNCTGFTGTYDFAGFSDAIYWGNTNYHPYGSHELLSGEWGAAIYYDGIATSPQAMWLTPQFLFPDWYTNSNFTDSYNYPASWDNSNNPIQGNDTGKSVFTNSDVQITIDYEIAKVPGAGFSPVSYGVSGAQTSLAKSESYVILQTYSIKNLKSTNLTGIKFYQLLHSHGADDYGPTVHCSYRSDDVSDAMQNYTPFDSVHQVGKFRYDITQWNNLDDPNRDIHSGTIPHTDWCGFSSTTAPSYVECGLYPDHNGKPSTGTHVNIENQNLNGQAYSYGQTSGAMGWNLSNVAPGQTTKITVAFMFATNNWPYPTVLTKTNADPNNEPVRPFIGMGIEDNYLKYNVCYDANGYPLTSAVLTDYLPEEVDFNSCTGGGIYDANERTITWNLGNIAENDSNCFEVTTEVNYYAKPGRKFTNTIRLESSEGIIKDAAVDVNVSYWGGDIIYVDPNATGFNNGTSWDNAYTNLQDALTAARSAQQGEVTAIWVANGIYTPTNSTASGYQDLSFVLANNVAVIGHFGGIGTYEASAGQRNLDDPNNETILSGKVGTYYYEAVYNIVKATDVNTALLDGFTIKGAYSGSGVQLDNSSLSIVNCKFENNSNYGINVTNYSYPDIYNCNFKNNTSSGIRIYNHCQPEISYSVVDGNNVATYGMELSYYSVAGVTDSVFTRNYSYGIYASGGTLNIAKSEIKNSSSYGIYASSYADLIIDKTAITANSYEGLYADTGCDLTLTHSKIHHNGYNGIKLYDGLTATITNNWIYNNGTSQYASSNGGAGIAFNNQSGIPLIRHNTIYDNSTYGITSSRYGADPNILNCLIYANDSGALYRENGGSYSKVNYTCIQGGHTGNGNITSAPIFMGASSYDFHQDSTSPTKNAGDPNWNNSSDKDIDGEPREYERTDMGGDEYYWADADFNLDRIVNFFDYATLAATWQKYAGQTGYNDTCDLEDNNSIDANDLMLFCNDWLWQSAIEEEGQQMMMMATSSSSSFEAARLSEASLLSSEAKALSDESTESTQSVSADTSANSLMLTNATASIAMRPKRLAKKTDAFYAITKQTVDAGKAATSRDSRRSRQTSSMSLDASVSDSHATFTIEDAIDWLESIRQSDPDFAASMTDDEWNAFIAAMRDE